MKLVNKWSIFLKNTLLVPKLGYNLLSTKKLCGSDFIGQFDSDRIIITRRSDGKGLIKAKDKHGLFIVSKIVKEADKMTFYSELSKRKYLVPELDKSYKPSVLMPTSQRSTQSTSESLALVADIENKAVKDVPEARQVDRQVDRQIDRQVNR